MRLQDRIEQLLQECFELTDEDSCPLSKVIRRAMRLAKLREDTDNLLWLQWEMVDATVFSPYTVFAAHFIPEAAARYDSCSWRRLLTQYLEIRIREREVYKWDLDGTRESKPFVLALGIPQIEAQKEEASRGIIEALEPDPTGVAPYYHPVERANAKVDLSILCRHTTDELSMVLLRIRERVHSFLTRTEHEMAGGRTYAALFHSTLRYLGDVLPMISPQANEQLQVAWQRLREQNSEALSHALVSCRRALKSLADALYPPSGGIVKGFDGKDRVLGEDKYVNRLIQFLHENLKGRTTENPMKERVTEIARQIEGIYELSCKGVHATVERAEAEQCVAQISLWIADTVRIKEGTSAALLAPEPKAPAESS